MMTMMRTLDSDSNAEGEGGGGRGEETTSSKRGAMESGELAADVGCAKGLASR